MLWMSATAAKSRYLRQMNGDSSRRNFSPAAMSPAQARALIMAARSQLRPMLS